MRNNFNNSQFPNQTAPRFQQSPSRTREFPQNGKGEAERSALRTAIDHATKATGALPPQTKSPAEILRERMGKKAPNVPNRPQIDKTKGVLPERGNEEVSPDVLESILHGKDSE